MGVNMLTSAILLVVFASSAFAASQRILFEKCSWKGFNCTNSQEIPGKVDINFQCNTTVTTQDVFFYQWSFSSPATITSLTIQDCETVRISFQCTNENKPIQWLKIKNVKFLEIVPAIYTHNPPRVIFENITRIDTLPRHTFQQIKQTVNKPGCFVPVDDLEGVFFKDVNIGTIETEAFKNLTDMKNFSWFNTTVDRINVNAIHLTFADGGRGEIKSFNLDVVEPMAFRITGDKFSITRGSFGDIWASAVNGTIYDFEFSNNTVCKIQSGAISILAQNVHIIDNRFKTIESGAFQKIGPGLLHDSKRNFGRLLFEYKFDYNLIELVEDGGIRPDIVAYKNVAAEVTYTYNTMQCSCEGLTWLGADVDLGYGFSVLKDFNTMILDPQNSNVCSFTPCMCFGVRPPNKKSTSGASVF